MQHQRGVESVRFDSDIKGLLKGVGIGCSILCAVEMAAGIVIYAAGFFHLKADPVSIIGVILGSVLGTAVAVAVFWWMAASLQRSLDESAWMAKSVSRRTSASMAMLWTWTASGGKAVKKGVQAGYNKRLLAQAAWVAVAVFVPYINTVCGLIPLLFPKLAIYGLQITGKLNLTQPKSGGKGGET